MKSWQLVDAFGIEHLQMVDMPDPTPGAGQVLLRMKAWSLNYRDLLVVKGAYNPKIPRPFVPLSDGVGEIVEVGEGVSRMQVGDRVAATFMPKWIDGDLTPEAAKSALGGGGTGMLAEYVTLDAEAVVKVPDHLSDVEAAALPCAGVTAWAALVEYGKLRAGDVVLTLGTGGVSLFALQFARIHGAAVVITSSSDAKLERTKELGAFAGVNYRTEPEWDRAVRDRVGAVDHVIEVGGAGTMDRSLKVVRLGGRISLIGVLAGGSGFNYLPILMKRVTVQGIYVGSRAMFERMNRAIALHQLHPVVDRTFSFAAFPDALRYMESGKHFGKIGIVCE